MKSLNKTSPPMPPSLASFDPSTLAFRRPQLVEGTLSVAAVQPWRIRMGMDASGMATVSQIMACSLSDTRAMELSLCGADIKGFGRLISHVAKLIVDNSSTWFGESGTIGIERAQELCERADTCQVRIGAEAGDERSVGLYETHVPMLAAIEGWEANLQPSSPSAVRAGAHVVVDIEFLGFWVDENGWDLDMVARRVVIGLLPISSPSIRIDFDTPLESLDAELGDDDDFLDDDESSGSEDDDEEEDEEEDEEDDEDEDEESGDEESGEEESFDEESTVDPDEILLQDVPSGPRARGRPRQRQSTSTDCDLAKPTVMPGAPRGKTKGSVSTPSLFFDES
jgi:hypothetical protein